MAGKRSTANPRHANGNLRRKYRARLKAQGEMVIRSLKEDGITKEELLKTVDSVYEEDENA